MGSVTARLLHPSIATLPSDEISHLLVRHRRAHTLERYEPSLDRFLRQQLALAREFMSCETGAIFLDDPRSKLVDMRRTELTLIGAFGATPEQLLGRKQACHEGLVGRVYAQCQTLRITALKDRDGCHELSQRLDQPVKSVLAVPVVLGNSVCGVFILINRVGEEEFSARDQTLLDLFARYISSSMQNMLDTLRSREVARRDDLTGLFNDRYLQFRLRDEIEKARRADRDLSLLFLDLDHFKAVNDEHGHLEGSRTLHEVGLLIQGELGTDCIAARYGGDEFVVILPGVRSEEAALTAHQLREAFERNTFLKGGETELRPGAVTASIGVSSLAQQLGPDLTARDLANKVIRAADTAMYEAKARGKNTVVVSSTMV